MNNTVTYENPIRKKLKQAMSVLVIFVLMFAISLVLINVINNRNWNGNTVTAEGIVEKVVTEGETAFIILEGSEQKYSTTPIANYVDDFQTLQGKSVVIYTPEKQFGNGNPLIVGLTTNGEELVNAEQRIERARNENGKVLVVMAVLCGVCAAGVCAVAIWRINVPRDKEYPLGQKYVEFYAEKQPNCPQMKKYFLIFWIVWTLAVVIPIITIGILNDIKPQSDTVNFIFVGVVCAMLVLGAIGILLLKKWLNKKNLEFYVERYPFDFADISHVRMKKDVREQIEKEMREDLELHPHYQGDGGNGYLTKFTEKGVELYIPDFWEEAQMENNAESEPKIDVPAQEIFDLPSETATAATETSEAARDEENKTPVLTLTYEEANFEAVPYFNKPRPLFVVIKSRLTPNERYPEELVNDLHFLLDVNLLKTLQTFSVPVENLDNILENKRELMLEAAKKSKHPNAEKQQ